MNHQLSRFLTTGTLVVAALALGACATTTTLSGRANAFTFDPDVKEPTNRSNVKVKLSTSAQKLYVVEGDKVLLATPVSVGTAATPTPKGTFPVRAKVAERRRVSSPGAGYPMPYWIEFYGPAYGMHWGFVKPYPSTMGCVRMPLKSAKKVFNLVSVGTPINIATTQPEDQTIGKTLPVLDDGPLPNPPDSYMLSSQAMADIRQGKLWKF
ncbi:MAG: L,D-transpeptidase [Chthoniobacterales bacterium]